MKRVGVFPVTQTMLFTTKKILCGFICTFFFCVAPFIICSFLHSLYRRASVEARPDLLSHVYTSKLLHAAASKHSGKHSSTPGYALLLWSLFAVCVCDRWRERGLPFWSGSRQTHENGPYSKFRTGITTFFLYTVLDKCETSTFSRLHTCSSNFVMLCPRHGWYYLFSVIRWSVLGQILNALFPLMLPLLCDSVSER